MPEDPKPLCRQERKTRHDQTFGEALGNLGAPLARALRELKVNGPLARTGVDRVGKGGKHALPPLGRGAEKGGIHAGGLGERTPCHSHTGHELSGASGLVSPTVGQGPALAGTARSQDARPTSPGLVKTRLPALGWSQLRPKG